MDRKWLAPLDRNAGKAALDLKLRQTERDLTESTDCYICGLEALSKTIVAIA